MKFDETKEVVDQRRDSQDSGDDSDHDGDVEEGAEYFDDEIAQYECSLSSMKQSDRDSTILETVSEEKVFQACSEGNIFERSIRALSILHNLDA